jgi:hypothetical protein
MTTLYGILLGLAAAATQCGAYLASRAYVVGRRRAYLRLLATSHLYMGVYAAALLPFVWTVEVPRCANFAGPLAASTLFYLVGQAAMLLLMRMTNPSRVAPLLGGKIVVLALLASLLFGHRLTPGHWAAVAACAAAVCVLNVSGGSLPGKALLVLLLACTGYSLSDLNIYRLVLALQPLGKLRASLVGAALAYLLSGMLVLPLTPWLIRTRQLADWRYVLPFSLFWFAAMIGLFASIACVGPVFGIILQSTRGLMSIAVGAYVARLGYLHVEGIVSRRVLLQRIAAALLMSAAIGLYAASG